MKPIQRRAFIRNAGAAVAATTATAAAATAAVVTSPQPLSVSNAKLASEEHAIQQLHHALVARLNSRQHEGLDALFASEPQQQVSHLPVYILGEAQHLDTISVAPGQQHATARFHCLARLEAALGAGSPSSLLEMARQQGQGVIQWWESGVLQGEYVKVASLWKIAKISFVATTS